MSAVDQAGASTTASQETFAPGASWHGTRLRAWMAWHCVKR